MMNLMEIDGYQAFIQYDPEIEMFRGEFIGLNGGADFYAKDVDSLHKEGSLSLKIYLEMCKEEGIETEKDYCGSLDEFILSSQLYKRINMAAIREGKTPEQWLNDIVPPLTEKTNIDEELFLPSIMIKETKRVVNG